MKLRWIDIDATFLELSELAETLRGIKELEEFVKEMTEICVGKPAEGVVGGGGKATTPADLPRDCITCKHKNVSGPERCRECYGFDLWEAV